MKKLMLLLMAMVIVLTGVADAQDEEYVLVGLSDTIIKLAPNGDVIDGSFIVDPDHLGRVGGLAIKDGVLYAASRHTGSAPGEISKYDLATGEYLGQFAQLLTCESLRLGPDGNLYAAGRDAGAVKGWDADGNEIFSFSTGAPWGLDFDDEGYLYTVDNGSAQYKKVLLTDSSVVSDYAPYAPGKTYRCTVVFAPNGVLYGMHDGQGIDKILPGTATNIVGSLPGFGAGVNVFPDGKIYIPGGGQKSVYTLDPDTDSIDTWVTGLAQETNSVLYVGGEAPPVPTQIVSFTVSDQTSASTAKTNAATVDVNLLVTTGEGVTIDAYFITEEEFVQEPPPDDPGWVGTQPATYTITGGEGTVTIYAYVRDSNGVVVGASHQILYATPVAWEGDYVLIGLNDTVMKVAPDGTAIDANFIMDDRLQGVRGLAAKDDVLYVGNAGAATVEKYDLATGEYIGQFAQADQGWRYVAWRNWETIKGFAPDGTEVFSYVGAAPWGMDFRGGYLYTVHNGDDVYKKVLLTDASDVSDYAPYSVGKSYMSTVVFAPNGVLYGMHDGNGIDKVTGPGSSTSIVAHLDGFGPGVDVFADGRIYIPAGGQQRVDILDPSTDSLSTWVDSLPQACYSVLYVGEGPPPTPTTIIAFSVSDQTTGSTSKTNEPTVNVSMTVTPGEGATITGYMLTETPDQPALDDPNWLASLPATYTITGGEGTVTIYGWVKDDLGTVAGETTEILYREPVPWEGNYVLVGLYSKIIKLAPNGDVIDDSFIVDPDHLGRVGGLAIKDGVLYAGSRHTGSAPGEISKYDLATGEYLGRFAEILTCEGIKFGPDGNLYAAGRDAGAVKGWDADGNLVFSFATGAPWGVDFDDEGYLYTVDNGSRQYRKVLTTDSSVSWSYAPYAPDKTYRGTVIFAPDGSLYGIHDGQGIDRVPPGGGSATTVASVPCFGSGVSLFPDGKLYIPGGGKKAVYALDPADDSVTTWLTDLEEETNSVVFVDVTPKLEITEFVVTDRTTGSPATTNEAAVNISIQAVAPPGETVLGYQITETPEEPEGVYRHMVTDYVIQAPAGSLVTLYGWALDTAGNVARKPYTILYNPDALEGVVLVGSSGKIMKLTADGSVLDHSFIDDADHLKGPVRGLAVKDGVLYAGSADDATVHKYDLATGEYLGQFAQADQGWRSTEAVKLGPDGNIYVAWRNWETIKGFTSMTRGTYTPLATRARSTRRFC